MANEPLLIDFNGFLDKYYIDVGGALIAGFVAISVAYGVFTWRPTLRSIFGGSRPTGPSPSKSRAILRGLVFDVVLQKPVKDCSAGRWAVHFSIFWGFVGLAVATTLDAIINPLAAPLPLASPVRVIGNVSGILFLVGVSLSIGRRVVDPDVRRNSSLADALFLFLLFATGITGFATEYFSDLNFVLPDLVSFAVHVVFVTALLVTAPFTKFVHSIGRPILLLLKRLAGTKASS
jgi:nitrate reductase gamma subunit